MNAAIGLILADANGGDGHMDWDGAWWMWIWGPLMLVTVVLLIVWLVRAAANPGTAQGRDQRDPTERAREILAERYASGEIDTDEYRERLEHLQ